MLQGELDELSRALDAEFPHDVAAVRLCRGRRYVEAHGNFFVTQGGANQRKDRAFPLGQNFYEAVGIGCSCALGFLVRWRKVGLPAA